MRKGDDKNIIKITNMKSDMLSIEESKESLLKKYREMEAENSENFRKSNYMNSMLTSLVIQLTKIKDEHMQMKDNFAKLNKENEFLKDKHGIDLGQLTPRPNWKGLSD
jgi:peptidoglycan hydrolase CwlO-like protein